MKKIELVYREILQGFMEKKKASFTQLELATALDISLSTVNHALKPLKNLGAIDVTPRNFTVTSPKKILYYWASIRNMDKDVIYTTRTNNAVEEIEKNMPQDITFTAFSAYKFRFKDAPADYSEVYVYADDVREIEKRFPKNKNMPNLIVLKKDKSMGKEISIAQLFVDLWNLKQWYAKDFVSALEARLNGILA